MKENSIHGDQVRLSENQTSRATITSAGNLNKTRPRQLREGTIRDRVDRLLQLAEALLTEAEAFAYGPFNAEAPNLKPIDLRTGIDFYKEVQRFEMNLIKRALDETGGSQVKAARMLGMKMSTLHTKIKRLKIVPR